MDEKVYRKTAYWPLSTGVPKEWKPRKQGFNVLVLRMPI
jgi:hypothetical protein